MTTIAVEDLGRASYAPDSADGAHEVAYFARQPILNRDGMLCGYELKVCEPDIAESAVSEPAQRIARAVVRGLLGDAVRGALTGHPAYVDVSRAMLFDDSIVRLL